MKKVWMLAALSALIIASCGKEVIPQQPVEPEPEPLKLVFDITPKSLSGETETKAVKTGWESGDIIYVFFEDNTSQYLRMTYDGTAWNYTDKDGGVDYIGLALSPSGKKLTAVWFPPYVNSEPPYLDGDVFRFNAHQGYYLTAEGVDYTITSTGGENSVSATLDMKMPEGFLQIKLNQNLEGAYTDGRFILSMSYVAPARCDAITPGGSVEINIGKSGYALPGLVATIDGSTDYYFYGILDSDKRGVYCEYDLLVVEQDPVRGFATRSYYKWLTRENSSTGAWWPGQQSPKPGFDFCKQTAGGVKNNALKLGQINEWESFVYLKLPLRSPKVTIHPACLAVGNLQENSPYIAAPLQTGDYYKWGEATPYRYDAGEDYYNYRVSDDDRQDPAKAKNNKWEKATGDEYNYWLMGFCTYTWKNSTEFPPNGGYLFTSNENGVSIFFPAAGYSDGPYVLFKTQRGYYVGGGIMGTILADGVTFDENLFTSTEKHDRRLGMSIRPVTYMTQ